MISGGATERGGVHRVHRHGHALLSEGVNLQLQILHTSDQGPELLFLHHEAPLSLLLLPPQHFDLLKQRSFSEVLLMKIIVFFGT